MRKLLTCVSFLAVVTVSRSQATILRFNFTQPAGTPIALDYGSNLSAPDNAGATEGTGWTPDIMLRYKALDQNMNLLTTSIALPDPNRAYYWDTGAASLINVIYSEDSRARFLEIAFMPTNGSAVNLHSVDLGAFQNIGDQSVSVLDNNFNQVFNTMRSVPTIGSTTVNFNGLVSTGTLYLRVGLPSSSEGSYLIGLDNLSFDQSDPVNQVPEAETIVLSGLGLTVMICLHRVSQLMVRCS
jgi:hypothetical protein